MRRKKTQFLLKLLMYLKNILNKGRSCVHVDGPLGSHPLIRGDVDGVCGRVMTDS